MKRLLSTLLTVAATLAGSTAFAVEHEVRIYATGYFPNAVWFQNGDTVNFVNSSIYNLKLAPSSSNCTSFIISGVINANSGPAYYTIPNTTQTNINAPCIQSTSYSYWGGSTTTYTKYSNYTLSLIRGTAPTTCPSTELDSLATDPYSTSNACPLE